MRSPVIAFSILAAAAVSPSLVAGAPTSPNPDTGVVHSPRMLAPSSIGRFAAGHGGNGGGGSGGGGNNGGPGDVVSGALAGGNVPGVPGVPGVPETIAKTAGTATGASADKNNAAQLNTQKPSLQSHRAAEQQLHNPSPPTIGDVGSHSKRASDQYTAGGNSYTGATSSTSGGNAIAVSHGNTGDPAVDGITNEDDVTGGAAGDSFSGFSYGGDGGGHGPGGNAYSGAVASSYGGDVINDSDDGIDNEGDNLGGAGGFDESGDSVGGDAHGFTIDNVRPNVHRRAGDQGTAGGNAYTGASGNVDGGDIINHSNADDTTTNEGTITGGAAGDTYSGDADGGNGNGYGPGGNAYTGSTGSAKGGSVYNFGGTIDNEDTVTGGAGGESESGDAVGGDA
ncbi:uncharacterized protein FIBRA_03701 [Fibroporia radiculosa]|uniref:Uncharacterized protein n=1 Tax=Fibroporia radiculosa TaxID=599839 RepID=J4GNM3_9APHY|nr:uncharacterized protein FIBRA_03701 [Fibroporia radiculosa]CCM01640.1 predicted protein [Fibroporia radiculosa]